MNADSDNSVMAVLYDSVVPAYLCSSAFICGRLKVKTAFSHDRMRPLVGFCFRGAVDASFANYSLDVWDITMQA